MTGLALRQTCRARLRARASWVVASPLAVLAVVGGAATGGAQDLAPLSGITASVGGAVVFTLLVGGWLGEELRSGTALFWIQLPGTPVILHGARFLSVAAVGGLLAIALPGVAAGGLSALGQGPAAHEVLLRVPALALALAILGVLIWTTGGWGVRGDAWAGPLLGVVLTGVELAARLRPDALGFAAVPADAVGLPLDDLASAAALLAGTGGDGGALIGVLTWIAGWGLAGAVGVHRSVRDGGISDRAA